MNRLLGEGVLSWVDDFRCCSMALEDFVSTIKEHAEWFESEKDVIWLRIQIGNSLGRLSGIIRLLDFIMYTRFKTRYREPALGWS